jgi:hypothetical protein
MARHYAPRHPVASSGIEKLELENDYFCHSYYNNMLITLTVLMP